MRFWNSLFGFGSGQRVVRRINTDNTLLYSPMDWEDFTFGAWTTVDDISGEEKNWTLNDFDVQNLTDVGGVSIDTDDDSILFNTSILTSLDFSEVNNYSIVCFASTEELGSWSTRQDVVGCYNTSINNSGFIVRKETDSNRLSLFYLNAWVFKWLNRASPPSFVLTSWVPIGFALTANWTTWKSYDIDWEVNSRDDIPVDTFSPVSLGSQGSTAFSFKGKIHNICFYNRTLSASEVNQILSAWPNAYAPVADWLIAQYNGKHFAGTAGTPTTIYDTNMIVNDERGRQAVKFNWVNSYIRHSVSSNFRSITIRFYTDWGFNKGICGRNGRQSLNIASDGKLQAQFTLADWTATRRFFSTFVLGEWWYTVTAQQGSAVDDVEMFINWYKAGDLGSTISTVAHYSTYDIWLLTTFFDWLVGEVYINQSRKITLNEHRTIHIRQERLLFS